MLVLGIETSCDETGVALVDKGRVIAQRLGSQIDLHAPYGGIVPEIAARAHFELLLRLVDECIAEAQINTNQIELVAATQGPGLVGCLLVGLTFAKGIAYGWNKPFIGINHLHAHFATARMCDPPAQYPFVGLLVSGGHTLLALVKGTTEYELLGATLDDAVGEAYDKVAQLLRLGYPGGRPIENAANSWNGELLDLPRPMLRSKNGAFSFSGLKTAVAVALNQHRQKDLPVVTEQFSASFQTAAIDVLEEKLFWAVKETGVDTVAVVGGVAANQALGNRIRARAQLQNLTHVAIPPPRLCTDNGTMIAFLAPDVYIEKGASALGSDAMPNWGL